MSLGEALQDTSRKAAKKNKASHLGAAMSLPENTALDRVRAARFPGSERSSLATGSAPPRYQDGAAPDLPGKKKKNKNPENQISK